MSNQNCYLDRDGKELPIPVSNNRLLERLFRNPAGRFLLKLASGPVYSNIQRVFLDSPFSAFFISGFVKKNGIRLSDYPRKRYRSFEDFFTREIRPGKRKNSGNGSNLISPCDCKAEVHRIGETSHFRIKDVDYTVGELLENVEAAGEFCGGWLFLLRLSVEDYHHYCYPCSGRKEADISIAGKLYTVNPMIHRFEKVYRENARTYSYISGENGRRLLMMEVGALGVGRIKNELVGEGSVLQGADMGHFEFGGSTILLLVPKESFLPSEDLVRNTGKGFETVVKQGEEIGYAYNSGAY